MRWFFLFLGCMVLGASLHIGMRLYRHSQSDFSDVEYESSNKEKVGVLYIALGKYIVLWDDFYKSAEQNFLPNAPKTYFVWTDDMDKKFPPNVIKIPHQKMGWPYDSMMRFRLFLEQKELLKQFDYLYFFNADMLVKKPVGAEIFPTSEQGIMVVQHVCHFGMNKNTFPYSRNPKSWAYIPYGQGNIYVTGAFNGGTATAFLKMADELNRHTQEDLEKGGVPVWHDESYLNKYILDKKPLIMSPAYGFMEEKQYIKGSGRNFEKTYKVLKRDKKKYGGRTFLRE